MIKSAFKVIFIVCLSLYSIYAIYIVDDKTLSAYGFVAWVFVGYFAWQGDRAKAKAKEEKRLELLNNRVAYLERELQQRER
jgi:hypothetical protein